MGEIVPFPVPNRDLKQQTSDSSNRLHGCKLIFERMFIPAAAQIELRSYAEAFRTVRNAIRYGRSMQLPEDYVHRHFIHFWYALSTSMHALLAEYEAEDPEDSRLLVLMQCAALLELDVLRRRQSAPSEPQFEALIEKLSQWEKGG